MAKKGKEAKTQEKSKHNVTQFSRSESHGGQTTSKKETETSVASREQFSPARATISPFSLMRRFSEEMDRVFGDFSLAGGFAPGFSSSALYAALPGLWHS